MEKIIINPEEVRGLGNIVSPKSTSSFILSDSELSSATESVNGVNLTTYHLTCATLGLIGISVSSSSITVGAGFTATATVVDRLGTPIEGVSVTFTVNGTAQTPVTTNSSGQVTLTQQSTTTAGTITISAAASGYGSATATVTVNKHTSSVLLSIASSTVTVGGTFILSGTLSIDGTGKSGETVKIYQDDTLIGTKTTGSNGTFSMNVSATTVGTTKFQAVYEGSSTINSSQTPKYTCTVSKKSSNLNITVPVLVYQDNFSVTGVLKDGSNNALSGKSVKLYMEHNGTSSLQATQTTDSNGEVTFARTAPTTITTYKFWLEFDGDSTYSNCTSSVEERTVQKETTAFTSVLPANNSQYTVGDNVTISGVLVSDDVTPELISGKNIRVMENNNVLAWTTTGNDGSFSMTLQNLAAGTHSLYITFQGDTYYNYVIIPRTIVVQDVATVSTVTLTSDKSILSYADSEYATLTATALTSQNVGVPGQEIMFYAGTPEAVVNCTSGNEFSTVAGSPTFDSNGMTLHEGSDKVIYNPSQFTMALGTTSYKIFATCTKPTGGDYLGFVIVDSYGDPHYKTAVFILDDSINFFDTNLSLPSGLGDTIEVGIEINPTSQKLYINGSLVGTNNVDFTSSGFEDYIYLGFWDSLGDFIVERLVIYEDDATGFVAYGTTDSNGEATARYDSQGIGDISFVAQCGSILSETYTIEDCIKYDNCSSNNLSNYTIVSGTVTYDSTEHSYNVNNSTTAEMKQLIPYSNDFECTCDLKYLGTPDWHYFYYGVENNNQTYQLQSQLIRSLNRLYFWYNNSASSDYSNVSPSQTTNQWYTVKVIRQGTTATVKLYNGSTEMASHSITVTETEYTYLRWYLQSGQVAIKNIKVKPL